MALGGLTMKLSYNKNSSNPTYYIQKSYRNGKKTTTKNVKTIGKHNDLLKITDDPLSYAKNMVKEFNDQIKNNKINLDISIDFDKKLSSLNSNVPHSQLSNIGYFFLQHIYHDLKIKNFIDEIASHHKIKYNANDINRFLTFARILEPNSKLGTYDHLDMYYENPDLKYHSILRFLTLLSEHFDDYIAYLLKHTQSSVDLDTSVCYFDCTNYYFEIEQEDEDYIDDVTGEIIKGFRKYTISKQHQPTPHVQMGLFMDSHGIPISMCLNPGSDNENKCAAPAETKLIQSLENKKIIYCADAGLGSYDIRKFNSFGSRAFIVTQSIKKLSSALKEAVFNDCDYKLLSNNTKITIEQLKGFDRYDNDNLHLYNDHAYKVIKADQLVDLGLTEEKTLKNGKKRKQKVSGEMKQYIIVTFSRKMMEYQRKIRNNQIERAKRILSSQSAIDDLKKNANDARRFIKKVNNGKEKYILNEDKIREEEKYDGYYAIATNLDAPSEAKEIIEKNSQRYKIEDCFRVLKSYFKARPINHRLKERIIAHFMICYTSLLIYRILEVKLDQTGTHYTTGEILESLKNMNVFNNHDLYYQAVYTGGTICDALNSLYDLELDKEYYQPKVLNKKIRKIIK